MIGVTGATGEVGRRVAARLADRGVAQRLVVRDRARAPRLAGAEVVEFGGYSDRAGMRRAFEGISPLFLVSAGEAPDRLSEHRAAVDAAGAAGVDRLVYLSFLGAAPDATFTFARDHFHTEEHIRDSGIGSTFSRQSIYLDFVPTMVGEDGVIRGPAGDGRFAPVLRDDVADALVAMLTEDGHVGQAYELTGPELVTMAEVAAAISAASGDEIRYHAETLEEARASRAPSGAQDWEIEGWVTSYAAIATGELEVVTGDVRRLGGHDPAGVADYVSGHFASGPASGG